MKSYWRTAPSASHKRSSSSYATILRRKAASVFRESCLTGDVTIVKCGGESLDEYYLSTGTVDRIH